MKKRTCHKSLFTLLFAFGLSIALCACGKEDAGEIPVKVFGVDYSMVQELGRSVQVICNADSVWAITNVKNDPIHKWALTASGMESEEQIEWQSEDGNYDLINILERQGTLYVETRNREDDTLMIRKRGTNKAWNDVLSVRVENPEDYAVMGRGFYLDGDTNVYLVSGDHVTRFNGDGQKTCTYELKGDIVLWTENSDGSVECLAATQEEIILYELVESKAEEKWTLKTSSGKLCGISCDEEETLCLATDSEILFLSRESGKILSKTDPVRLGIPSVLAGYYDAQGKTLQLCGPTGNGSDGLQYTLLSERDASEEQRTELIYGVVEGVNSDASSSVRTAINTFNLENRDYYITIRDYGGNLTRMQADMAAGNGPDIIDMMDIRYYESYVQNGYLEDLTPYLEQSQYSDDILWNVLDTYRIDGKLYLFMPQFWLQGLTIHPEYAESVEEWNMETFFELLEQNQWEKDVLDANGNPGLLLYYLFCGRQEEFIDTEQRTAAFETDEFMDMLALCREYGQTYRADGAEGKTYSERKPDSLFSNCLIADFGLYLSDVNVYGREYRIYGYPTLSGQTYEIAACLDSCAIYAGSDRKEGAWAFIESLLWESNQKYRGISNPGLPIRISVLEELAEQTKSETYRFNNGEQLTITENEIAIVEDILYNGELCRVSLDPDIRSVIDEEAAAYFAGDRSAQEAAHIIQSRVQLILQE
ncbi:MAG: ABC transporter substrate-binding protein [Clostridium sp.]|nr:ABC transporter substrate-binding protein [Acetatifactor muris]MCM1528181.1 ABC transporter substrate-binding protein [Bacteroides sp.]MCM1564119.1 ABC transporter substrate-binding protein [Clostridium sp.]